MFKLTKVVKRFGDNTVLNEVDFEVKQGEFVALTGPSGSGKSTLINLLIGSLKPEAGQIVANHKEITELDSEELQMYRRSLGVIFQDYKLLKKKTVYENIAFALEVIETPDELIKDKVLRAIQIVGLLGKEDRFPDELSGGEQQRVAIARAIVHEPKFIFADEPTGNLDITNSHAIADLFLEINKEMNTTTLITTHDPNMIKWLGCRVVEIRDGKVWETVGDDVQITHDIIDEN